jgi:hypothetical protein
MLPSGQLPAPQQNAVCRFDRDTNDNTIPRRLQVHMCFKCTCASSTGAIPYVHREWRQYLKRVTHMQEVLDTCCILLFPSPQANKHRPSSHIQLHEPCTRYGKTLPQLTACKLTKKSSSRNAPCHMARRYSWPCMASYNACLDKRPTPLSPGNDSRTGIFNLPPY